MWSYGGLVSGAIIIHGKCGLNWTDQIKNNIWFNQSNLDLGKWGPILGYEELKQSQLQVSETKWQATYHYFAWYYRITY